MTKFVVYKHVDNENKILVTTKKNEDIFVESYQFDIDEDSRKEIDDICVLITSEASIRFA